MLRVTMAILIIARIINVRAEKKRNAQDRKSSFVSLLAICLIMYRLSMIFFLKVGGHNTQFISPLWRER